MREPDIEVEALEILVSQIGYLNALFEQDHNCTALNEVSENYHKLEKAIKAELPILKKDNKLRQRTKKGERRLYDTLMLITNTYKILDEEYSKRLKDITCYHLIFNVSLTPIKVKS